MKATHVEAAQCTRCGACSAACPGVFEIGAEASRVAREPRETERALALAARWICPADAIRTTDAVSAPAPAPNEPLFDELATGAERVRWSLADIPWDRLEPAKATAELRALVREMTFYEHATYSATQRFLEAFFDDVDVTQWIAVWFYEETKHPHALSEWLRRTGEPFADDAVLKGRVSTPFMRSAVGTLVTNVVSEVTVAQAYRRMAARSPEPVLAGIARAIAGDEARHAASFFRFARKRLAADPPEVARRERARGLEVLQAWLGGGTTHPVAQMIARLDATDHGSIELDFASTLRTRVVRVVGLLLDVPLERAEDVPGALRAMLSGRA